MKECITIINQKGGVAKTTTTYNLAASKALENPSSNILMIDLDPQASLTIACGIEPNEEKLEGLSTCTLFDGKADPLDAVFTVKSTNLENLYIVPSDIILAETEIKLITKMYGAEMALKKAVDKMASYFDYIFIDCPPQLGRLTVNALVACTAVIIPCTAEYLAYRGLTSLLQTIDDVKEINEDLDVLGIVVTMFESRVNNQKDVLELIEEKCNVLGTVRKSTDVRRNTAKGLPVVLAMPDSKTGKEYMEIAAMI